MIAEGYTARSFLHRVACMPREDWYAVEEKIGLGVVCDGVTRDPALWLPNKKSFWGKLLTALAYERPSKAGIISELCAQTVQEYLRETPERHTGALWLAFQKANLLINERNFSMGLAPDQVDYLMNNYGGCVASAALINDDVVHWAYLADCGVAVVDRKGNLKERTRDDGPDVNNSERWQHPLLEGQTWENPQARAFIRWTFVNKPDQKFSYGTLTGESNAMNYIRTGNYSLNEQDSVLVYSDGVAEALFKADGDIDGKSATFISQGNWNTLETLLSSRVKSEGTLVRLYT